MSVKRILAVALVTLVTVPVLIGGAGCGDLTVFLNPAFVNTTSGGVVPVTPGPAAKFVFVRARNETGETARFTIQIEREVLRVGDDGSFLRDPITAEFITDPRRETVQVLTAANGLGSDIGVLFPCGESPVTIVGLGEDLDTGKNAVFIGGDDVGGSSGTGVDADNLNALTLEASNFNCGDTIIFRAFRSTRVSGGVALQSLLLPGSEQPSSFSGPSTFENLENYLESQVREDDP